jgi:LCP family protein required for cell wall assembly
MIEQLLHETFATHEALAPAPEQVRARITAAARRRRWRRRSIGGTAVALVALVALVATTLVRPDALSRPGVVGGPAYLGDPTAPTGPVTFLLVGTDRGLASGTPGPRADAVVLAHLPAGGGAAYLISIPRGSDLDVFARDGMPALRAAVTARTGIPIDGSVEVDYAGVVAMVDAVGGVDLCVDVRVVSEHRPGQVYEPGCRHFTGDEAMDYLRQRRALPDGYAGRQRHNRQFLEAMYAKLAGADLATVTAVARAAGTSLRLDLGAFQLMQLFGAVRGLSPADVIGIEPPAAADNLWAAVTAGTLPDWVAANPGSVS